MSETENAFVPDECDLNALTARHLAGWPAAGDETDDRVFEIEKGGSGRRFFRIIRGERRVILMHYTLDRPENADFAAITDFLAGRSVPVPRILSRDDSRNLLWIEDLGEADLWLLRDADWESLRRPAYEATLRSVERIHQLHEADLTGRDDLPHFQLPFDAAMYRWEQDYFFERFVARFSAAEAAVQDEARNSAQLADLIAGLVELPRSLVHRDFQSQNVMLPDGEPRFIDYQGMRYGRPEYDVASLLFDPYVDFTHAERRHLARYYHQLLRSHSQDSGGDSFEEFENRLLRCAAQRLMQALGAYGFLGIDRKQLAFLDHIPAALKNLHYVAIEREILPILGAVLVLKTDPNCVA